MASFVERHVLTFPNLRDPSGEVFARFSVPYQPAWAFVDAAGNVEITLGALSDDGLDAALTGLAGS